MAGLPPPAGVEPWVYQRITETFVLDRRCAGGWPNSTRPPRQAGKPAGRGVHERQFWTPDEDTLDALRRAGEELEDNLEGIPAVAEAVA
jgi:magnesium chelatase subunit H